jgi:hypothetical protein
MTEPKDGGVVRWLCLIWSRQMRRLAAIFLLTGLLAFFALRAARIFGHASGLLFFSDPSGSLGVYSTNGTG